MRGGGGAEEGGAIRGEGAPDEEHAPAPQVRAPLRLPGGGGVVMILVLRYFILLQFHFNG